MPEEPKRLVEIRLIALVTVDLRDPELLDALKDAPESSSVTRVVADEIQSNLESVGYVQAAVVSRL